jgi:hypothetical protein
MSELETNKPVHAVSTLRPSSAGLTPSTLQMIVVHASEIIRLIAGMIPIGNSADFDRQASATNRVCFLGLSPPKASKIVSFFVSFHRGAAQSGILFLVSIE